ncbi:MAG: hypothetical protein ACT4OE_11230 [Sphingosinicella sp.]
MTRGWNESKVEPMGWTRFLLLLGALVVGVSLVLLLKGWQLLVWQTAMQGIVPGVQPLYACKYYTGRGFAEQWFDRAGSTREGCPFLWDERNRREIYLVGR